MPTAPKTVKTYVAARRLKIAPGVFREPEERKVGREQVGQLVPEAHLWVRQESWLHTGYLRLKEVPVTELQAAMDQFGVSKTDQAEIKLRLGLKPNVLRGPHQSPHTAGGKKSAPASDDQVKLGNLPGPVPARPDRKRRTAPVAPETTSDANPPAEKLLTRKSGGKKLILTPLRELDEDEPSVDSTVDLTSESVL